MKIGIDIRTACGRKNGKGIYTFNLVRELLKIDKTNEYFLYCSKLCAEFAGFANCHIKVVHKHPLLWHFAVIKDFVASDGEIFFAPTSFIIPHFLPDHIKSIITVHDLISFMDPLIHKAKAAFIENLLLKKVAEKAARIIVPSNNTKKDLLRLFDLEKDKVIVTPLGVTENYFGEIDSAEKARIKEKYHLPEEFILSVSGLEPRKNINVLVDAFLALPASHKNVKLTIVGGKGWKSTDLQKKIASHKTRVKHIENCAEADLPVLYKMAKIFIYPSLYEGFGLPPLEAMASGCPVICSNAASLLEVTGDAAISVNPKDAKAITENIKKLLRDENVRKFYIEKGLAQARKFSWKITAEKTLAAIGQ